MGQVWILIHGAVCRMAEGVRSITKIEAFLWFILDESAVFLKAVRFPHFEWKFYVVWQREFSFKKLHLNSSSSLTFYNGLKCIRI